jgi:hypothetical protein
LIVAPLQAFSYALLHALIAFCCAVEPPDVREPDWQEMLLAALVVDEPPELLGVELLSEPQPARTRAAAPAAAMPTAAARYLIFT